MTKFKTFVEENEIEISKRKGNVLAWIPFGRVSEFYKVLKEELNPYYGDEPFEYFPNGELQEDCICFDLTLLLDQVTIRLLMRYLKMETEDQL